jgi:hypothetical protein
MADLQALFAKLAELSEKERLDPTLVPAPYSASPVQGVLEDWLAALTPHRREKAETLLAIFQALGAQEGEMWVRSEISENIPQLSRYLLLRSIWKDAVHPWLQPGYVERELQNTDWLAGLEPLIDIESTADQILQSGLDQQVLAKFACFVAALTANMIASTLDGYNDLPLNAPAFVIQETNGSDELTGYQIDGLHESFLDPDVSLLT